MAPHILDGKALSNTIKDQLAQEVGRMKATQGITPGLAVVLVGNDPASQVYVRMKGKACEKAGIHSRQHTLDAHVSQNELLALIRSLNEDPAIHGILVQLPLPAQLDTETVLGTIDPRKDVDGFLPQNIGKLVLGEDGPKPCTPFGVLKLLEHADISTEGAHAVIVGRSNIVGKPLMNMLIQKSAHGNATVTLCHSRTKDLRSHTARADILVACVGSPKLITADMVREGAVVIDVGVNRVEDATREKGYRLTGDVDYDNVAPKCRAITPVPGGVGPMTIAMLLTNTVQAARALHVEVS
jgi:methylenetetrahydrofolate dehydrogenase (NADP+)/methenyltetrahydrofolate cyclohydrolase